MNSKPLVLWIALALALALRSVGQDSSPVAVVDLKEDAPSLSPNPKSDSGFETVSKIAGSDGSEIAVTNRVTRIDITELVATPGDEKAVVPAAVIARGADFRVIQTVTEFDAPDGSVLLKTNQFKISGPGIDGEGLLPGVQSFDLPPTIVQSDGNSTTVETITQFVAPDGSLTSKRTTTVEFKNDQALTDALSRPAAVSEWGAHAKVMQKQILDRREDGKWNLTSSSYTHLETGVAYQDEKGEWQDSVPEFEIVDGGVIGRRTLHKVALASSPTQNNPVDLTLPNGTHLTSRVLGLGYFDRSSGKSVVIAEIQDSQGQLGVGKDEIVYPNAFKDFSADLRYIFSKAGLEQDVVLNQQPPAPEDYGLDSATSQLEVITEFFPSVDPQITSRVIQSESDSKIRQAMAEPDLVDDTIDFGPMQMTYGRAFGLWEDDETLKAGGGVTMTKRWQKVDGRTILFEAVPLPELKPLLQKLPVPKERAGIKREASVKRSLPKISVAEKRKEVRPIQLAKTSYPRTGVLLDYYTVSSVTSSFTFTNGATYRVVGTVTMTGGTAIQTGAIIKYALGAILRVSNGLGTPASGKAYLLAETDNSVGEIIVTGAPVGNYAAQAISLYNVYNGTILANLEIRNATIAIDEYSPSSQTISNCKIVDSETGVRAYSTAVTLTSVTGCNVATNTLNSGSSSFSGAIAINCTFCAGDDYGNTIPSAATITLGSSTNGVINCAGDEDFFKFVLGATTTLNIYTAGTTDTQGYLLSSTGAQLATDDNSGSISNFSMSPTTLNSGTYYVRVRHTSGGTGNYQLTVSTWNPLVSRVSTVGALRSYSTGTAFNGYVGVQFTVGSSPISVKELGRWMVAGNSKDHLLQLFNSDGSAVANGSATVNMAGQVAGQFAYSALTSPVTLANGLTYAIMSLETNTSWADSWYDYAGTSIALSSGASNPWASWASPGANYVAQAGGSANNTYGPVDLRYATLVNTVPTITSTNGTQTINEDTNSMALNFTVGDAETPAAYLTMSGGSSNPTLIPVPNIVFGGSGANRTVTVTPAANQNGGPVTITLTVSDGAATASANFTVNVTAVNDRPSFNAGTNNVVVNEDCGAQSISWATGMSAGPADESGQALNFVVIANTNPGLFSVGPSISSGGTLTFTPVTNGNGSASITVNLQDSGGTVNGGLNTSTNATFAITVNPVNDTPTITAIANQTINQDSNTGQLAFTIGDVETTASSLSLSATSSNTNLVTTNNIVFGGSGASRTVTVTPTIGQYGNSTITVIVSDGSLSANAPFVLTVLQKLPLPVLTSAFNSDHSTNTVAATATGSTFRYTTNGVDPDLSSTTTPPTFSTPTTVKARAYQSGFAPSDVATLVITTNVAVTFSPNGHNPIEYSNGPLGILMTADAGSTIAFKAGTTGSLVTTNSGSSPSIDGIDSGNGTILAYAYKANTLKSANVTSLEYSFRLPQPTSTSTYTSFTSGVLTLSDAVAGASIRYTTNGTIPTAGSTPYTIPLTNSSSTRFYAKAFKAGYIDSGYITAWVNQLPAPKIATASGLLTSDMTVNNPIDIWLVPNFGSDNVYGEAHNTSGWSGPLVWSSDVPNVNFPGSLFNPASGGEQDSLNKIGMSLGRTYSWTIWLKGNSDIGTLVGIIDYDGATNVIAAEDINEPIYGATYLTQPLSSGATTAYLANEQAFVPISPTWYYNFFVPLTNFSRTGPIPLGNQPNNVRDIYRLMDAWNGSLPYVTTVNSTNHSVTLSAAYSGATLPVGMVVARRGAANSYQYTFYAPLPNGWNWYWGSASPVRTGTELATLVALLSFNGGNSGMTGYEFWEGSQAQRPNLYYTTNGSTAVYTQTPVPGPLKLTLDGNNAGVINLGQRGACYIDSVLNQRTITFKVATPQILATLNPTATSVTNVVTNATVGASIYYTTDGTDPTTSSTLYTAGVPVVFSSSVTTKWKAFKSNYTASDTATQWAVPVFNPLSGTYPSGQNVTITAPTGAQLEVFQPNPNLLNPGAWVAGSQGAQPGFYDNGATGENFIQARRTPYGTTENIWVAQNLDNNVGNGYDADGGWITAAFNIDKTKLYRFSVWIRKLDSTPTSTSGSTYLGCSTYGVPNVSDLTGTATDNTNLNPYFGATLLPLNEWHLLVGYVHPAGDLTTTHSGRGYNSKGQEVYFLTDFRWLPTATTSYQRAYLYYCTETGIQQEFWNPRVEVVNSVNDPIDILLATPENSPKTITLTGTAQKPIQAMSYSAGGVSGVVTSVYRIDSDGDGLPDDWEMQYFGNLGQNGTGDSDGDGLTNLQEYSGGTNPASSPSSQVAKPQITVRLNITGTSATNVVISTTVGAAIYYSTNGTDPTTSATLYNSNNPPVISETLTTKWKAFKDSYIPSDTLTQLPIPTSNPTNGTYAGGQNVTITPPAGMQFKTFQPNANLLTPSAWVRSSQGAQPGFYDNGAIGENFIDVRMTPYGTTENVWVAQNLDNGTGNNYDADGGWITAPFNIDKTKLYRFSVWIRKLDSTPATTSGSTYLGCATYGWPNVSDLAGTGTGSTNLNPYFWAGSLPLNDWYLLVGYVHPAGDLGTTHSSKMYNTAGQVVSTGTDFRWLPTATTSYQRAYLYYCTETGIQQEFWNPRVEVINSVSDPIDLLFSAPTSSPITVALPSTGPKMIQAMSYSTAGTSPAVTSTYRITGDDPAPPNPPPPPPPTDLVLSVSYTGSGAQVTLTHTTAGVAYLIFSKTALDQQNWTFEQQVIGAAGTTIATVPFNNRPTLFLAAGHDTDFDHDGLRDDWEIQYGLNPSNASDSSLDADSDGYTNYEEFLLGYNPLVADAPRPVVSISAPAPASVVESTTAPILFTLSRTTHLNETLVVRYEVNGTSDEGLDFQQLPGTVTFAAGQSTTTIPVQLINDPDDERDETVVITLDPDIRYSIATAPNNSATATILDDDLPMVSILATDPEATEAAGNTGQFTISREGVLDASLTVTFNASASTATYGTDYAATGTSITIPAGQQSAAITIQPLQDTLSEGTEIVRFSITAGSGYQINSGAASAQISITDDEFPNSDLPKLTVTKITDGAEPSTPGKFRITADRTLSTPVFVAYKVSGTATAASTGSTGGDYVELPSSVTIPAGATFVDIPVTVLDDSTPEPLETVVLVLAGAPSYQIGIPNSATVFIDDNEPVTHLVTIRPQVSTRYGQVLVTRTGPALGSVRYSAFSIATSPVPSGTFTDNNPITFLAGVSTVKLYYYRTSWTVPSVPLNFTIGTPPQSFTAPFIELSQSFNIAQGTDQTSENISAAPGYFTLYRLGNGQSGTAKIRLTGTAIAGNTGGSSFDYVVRDGSTLVEYSILHDADGSAYFTVTLPAGGATSKQIEIKALEDNTAEEWEWMAARFDYSDLSFGPYSNVGTQGQFEYADTGAYVWMRDSSSVVPTPTGPTSTVDSDGDGLSDWFENTYGNDSAHLLNKYWVDDVSQDWDQDGLNLLDEQTFGTNPTVSDTTGNGSNDFINSYLAGEPDNNSADVLMHLSPVRWPGGTCYKCHSTTMQIGTYSPLKSSTAMAYTDAILRVKKGLSYPITLTERDLPSQAVRTYSAVVAPLGPSGFTISDPQSLLGSFVWYPTGGFVGKSATLVTPDVKIAVDANRDGTIAFDSTDQTTSWKPYRFWLNDDHDTGSDDAADDLDPAPSVGPIDSADNQISNTRDLEDFSRIHLGVDGPGLLARLQAGTLTAELTVKSGAGSIRIFRMADSAGSLDYLNNASAAAQQITTPYSTGLGLVDATHPVSVPAAAWGGTPNSARAYLLFEGVNAGSPNFVLVLKEAGQAISESVPLFMSLSPVVQMYEHWTVGDSTVLEPTFPATLLPESAHFSSSSPEENKYILFVHGWRLKPWERRAFASTAYKRLWWQNYKGRFGLFSWPTDWNPDGLIAGGLDPQNYSRSEQRAWKSAFGLKALLRKLNGQYPGSVVLLAHSMGNIVASEALKLQGNNGQIVKTYIASQAATVAHAYDAVGPQINQFFTETPEVYAHYPLTGQPYFKTINLAAGSIVNYHNKSDYALSSLWETGQDSKPDIGWTYSYITEHWYRGNLAPTGTILYFPQDRAEIFAHIAEAQSRALGRAVDGQYTVGGPVSGSVDLHAAPFGYQGFDYEHSAEFRSTNVRRNNYWQSILASGF